MKNVKTLALVLAAGCAAPAMAQDSISKNLGNGTSLDGDAMSAGTAGAPYQNSAYTLKLTHLFTSWGTRFGIGPISKSSRTQATFNNNLISAQGISQTNRVGVPAASASYADWSLPTAGIDPVNNNTVLNSSVSGPAAGTQFGWGFADFGGEDNPVIGGVASYDPAAPDTLYVTRVVAAYNTVAGADTAQMGFGSVDSNGNLYFRVDDFSLTGPNPIQQDNIFRVRSVPSGALAGRGAGINLIDHAGGSDAAATDWIVREDAATTWNTPSNLPANLAGTDRGAYIGSNFLTNYAYGANFGGVTQTTAHRPGTSDHRGGVAFSPAVLLGGGSVGTAGMITKSTAGGGASDSLSIWGVLPAGAPINAVTVTVPRGTGVVLSDPCAAHGWEIGPGDFRYYGGSIAFRGGNAQVSVGKDQAGNGLVAATAQSTAHLAGTADNYDNGIAVYRFPAGNPTGGTWRAAAWIDFSTSSGKEIYGDNGADGMPFTGDAGEFDGVVDLNPNSPTYDAPIGTLVPYVLVNSSGILGPSISPPAFDSVGNIYFVSSAQLYKSSGVDYDTCLFRAVYDQANFCYKLELVLELGKTFMGQNSGTRWQMRFMTLSGTGGINPGAFWSNNVNQSSWNNVDVSTMDVKDPRTLGGLVLNASIVYDVDGDGNFDDATTDDEKYSVLLYIGNIDPGTPACPADFNGDGFLDFFDADAFVECFEGGACPPGKTADYNGDEFVDFFDADAFVFDFETGC